VTHFSTFGVVDTAMAYGVCVCACETQCVQACVCVLCVFVRQYVCVCVCMCSYSIHVRQCVGKCVCMCA